MKKLTIYEQLKSENIELGNHESDLYAKRTPTSTKIIDTYEHKGSVTTFENQISGEIWYDIPFAYDPFYKKYNK